MTLLGVTFHIAPLGREAEQHAADLAKAGLVDIVISNDTDTIMFGAPVTIMIKKHKGPDGKQWPYVKIDLMELLLEYELDFEVFQKMCVSLGTDFASKTPGVGKVTVFTKGKNKPLSEEQQVALEYIQSEPKDKPEVRESEYSQPDLVEWLVDKKNFNHERVLKRLA